MIKVAEALQARRRFVGRTEELKLLRRTLIEQAEWQLVHIFGPAGMGKTALLQQFGRNTIDALVLNMDASIVYDRPEQFLDVLGTLQKDWLVDPLQQESFISETERINQRADAGERILLLLDDLGYDSWLPIVTWLRTTWLPSLSTNIRICTSGRMPLTDWLAEEGWSESIVQIPVKPMDKYEWSLFLEEGGMSQPSVRDAIGRLCGGVPLLLALSIQYFREEVVRSQGEHIDIRQLATSLCRTFIASISLAEEELLLLGIASILYEFDQELLERMLEQPLSAELFQRFCSLPMIRPGKTSGWRVMNGIRKLARTELKERLPRAYMGYIRKAAAELECRLAEAVRTGDLHITDLTIGKLFLEDNDFIQSYVYVGEDSEFNVRPAEKEELPLLTALCERHLRETAPFVIDKTEQHRYVAELWEADPDSVLVITKQNEIKGMATPIRLHQATIDVLLRNPVTHKLLSHPEMSDCQYFYWMLGIDPPMDPDTMGYLFRSLFLPRLSGHKIAMMSYYEEASRAMPLLGGEALPWADHHSPDGILFRFFMLDSRTEAYPSNLKQEKDLSRATTTRRMVATKNYLQQFHKLEAFLGKAGTDDLECVPALYASLTVDQLALRIQDVIRAEHIRLNTASNKERTLALILEYAYLKKRSSHELVAARLDLSPASYYRKLKKLIGIIADRLFQV